MRSGAHWSIDVVAIEKARIRRGWTRRDLAREARVDEGTLCDLVAGRRRPTFGTLRAVCQALGLGLDDVIVFARGDSESEPSTAGALFRREPS
jgi:transcriptional regulator with XRE-family HTH domain